MDGQADGAFAAEFAGSVPVFTIIIPLATENRQRGCILKTHTPSDLRDQVGENTDIFGVTMPGVMAWFCTVVD